MEFHAGGAWLIVLIIPLLVFLLFAIHRTYMRTQDALVIERLDEELPPMRLPVVIVPVGRLDPDRDPAGRVHEAAAEVLAYKYRSLQMWESTELAAPWINLMREAINGQVFSHGNPDFLAVAAVHGTAHLALFNQTAWDKHELAELTGGKIVKDYRRILDDPNIDYVLIATPEHWHAEMVLDALADAELQRLGLRA